MIKTEDTIVPMTSEQKIELWISNYFDTCSSINKDALMVLCMMAYFMGKTDGMEKSNESNISC